MQRVSSASVRVDGETVGRCGPGLLVLLGVRHQDTSDAAVSLAGKVARLRIFANERGRFDLSLLDVGGEFCGALSDGGVRVETGVFGAMMEVELVNDGPVTIVLDS